MSISSIIPYLVVGISMGAVYALIALGFMTIFRASKIVNFAQGEFVMMGGFLTNFFIITCHFPYWLSALLGVVGVLVANADEVVLRNLKIDARIEVEVAHWGRECLRDVGVESCRIEGVDDGLILAIDVEGVEEERGGFSDGPADVA